jgi:glycerol-3-phosphate dehydrogenase
VKRDVGALVGREHDLLIVGGGIHGVAAAWDAAQRGIGVALVEAHDFGSGVSWNSLKTIHGGLRYLQSFDLRRMRESIRERSALLRIAPRLVRPLPFVVPTYGHGSKGRETFAVALGLNDLISADRNRGLPPEQSIPRGRLLSRREVLGLFPGVDDRGLTGGALWTDAQVQSSERLALGFLHGAFDAGAVLANRVEVTSLLQVDGRVAGVRARDLEGGSEIEVRARMVVNSTGPGIDRILALAGIRRSPAPLLRALNFVLARGVVTTHALGALSGGRFLFLVPWRGRSMVGTAYASSEVPPGGEENRLLAEAQSAYPWAHLESGDVAVVHRGLVPGHGGADGLVTRDLLLDHERTDGVAGLISMQGVKYTTARAAAEAAVNLALRRLGRSAPACRTATTPLPRARPLEGSLEERVLYAVREEMALGLADVILRRLDLGTAGQAGEEVVDAVSRVMTREFGWTPERGDSERRELAARYMIGAQSG